MVSTGQISFFSSLLLLASVSEGSFLADSAVPSGRSKEFSLSSSTKRRARKTCLLPKILSLKSKIQNGGVKNSKVVKEKKGNKEKKVSKGSFIVDSAIPFGGSKEISLSSPKKRRGRKTCLLPKILSLKSKIQNIGVKKSKVVKEKNGNKEKKGKVSWALDDKIVKVLETGVTLRFNFNGKEVDYS
ncbi:hypothetical protein LWI28_001367 [Acer negundo]|uniref:Uncharacterized protein n=1 Tax=Acer negundo TaxID=4023 RepID=A0AAD5NW23_ACENE|nr:hypothetical protein LWI28_001367 [Acer negundo]